MSKHLILPLFFSIILSLITTLCDASPLDIYEGTPSFTKIPASIKSAALFKEAPAPSIKVLDYESREMSGKKKYSNYTIRLKSTKNQLTHYKTVEYTSKNDQLFGEGVGYGGIFSMQYFKKGDLERQKNFYKKYQWRDISNVNGSLFPLQVGNRLSFHYKEVFKDTANAALIQNKGQIVYEVLDVIDNYKNGATEIPGKTYVIKFSKSTKENSPLLPQNLYYFSEKLGWYVYAKYYFAGKPLVEYKITKWR